MLGHHSISRAPVSSVIALPIAIAPPIRFNHGVFPPLSQIHSRSRRAPARPPEFLEFFQTFSQGFRIADTSLCVFELFVGEGESPNFCLPPAATSLTLPFFFTPTPPASGQDLDLHVVVRRRNEYDLFSFNVFETILRIDSAGAEVLGPVSAPENVAVYNGQGGSGFVRVLAQYISTDDADPADTWEVYAKEGSDPVVGVDPILFTGAMQFLGDEAILTEELSGSSFGAGDTLHVLVCAVRASDTERACAPVVQFILAITLALGTLDIFGGSFYEQR